jgi:hypothetical protein
LPHVEGLLFLLLLAEEVHSPVVDGSCGLVVLLHDGQCCAVVRQWITCVASIANFDAARHLGLVVSLERRVHAVEEVALLDLFDSGVH